MIRFTPSIRSFIKLNDSILFKTNVTFFFRSRAADRGPWDGSFRLPDRKGFRDSTSAPSCPTASTKRPETKIIRSLRCYNNDNNIINTWNTVGAAKCDQLVKMIKFIQTDKFEIAPFFLVYASSLLTYLVNFISLSQSDHVKWLLLFKKIKLRTI